MAQAEKIIGDFQPKSYDVAAQLKSLDSFEATAVRWHMPCARIDADSYARGSARCAGEALRWGHGATASYRLSKPRRPLRRSGPSSRTSRRRSATLRTRVPSTSSPRRTLSTPAPRSPRPSRRWSRRASGACLATTRSSETSRLCELGLYGDGCCHAINCYNLYQSCCHCTSSEAMSRLLDTIAQSMYASEIWLDLGAYA